MKMLKIKKQRDNKKKKKKQPQNFFLFLSVRRSVYFCAWSFHFSMYMSKKKKENTTVLGGCPRGVMVKAIVGSYLVKGMNSHILPAIGQIVPILFWGCPRGCNVLKRWTAES